MESVDSSCVEMNECPFAYFNHIKRSSAHRATFRPSTPTLQILTPDLVTQIVIIKPASNDFGCICEQSWKDQCSMEVYITINHTKSYCSKLLIKLVITTKNFFLHSLCYLSELLSLVTCKQRADHFTPMM